MGSGVRPYFRVGFSLRVHVSRAPHPIEGIFLLMMEVVMVMPIGISHAVAIRPRVVFHHVLAAMPRIAGVKGAGA